MASTQDPNEQNFIATALIAITSNNIDAPRTGEIAVATTTVRARYATRTAVNVSTGQTESDTALIIN